MFSFNKQQQQQKNKTFSRSYRNAFPCKMRNTLKGARERETVKEETVTIFGHCRWWRSIRLPVSRATEASRWLFKGQRRGAHGGRTNIDIGTFGWTANQTKIRFTMLDTIRNALAKPCVCQSSVSLICWVLIRSTRICCDELYLSFFVLISFMLLDGACGGRAKIWRRKKMTKHLRSQSRGRLATFWPSVNELTKSVIYSMALASTSLNNSR